jgi:ferric-dicitrate binding protein FerR (iron transport regulator)
MKNEEINKNELHHDPEFKEIWDLASSYTYSESDQNDEAWSKFKAEIQPKAKMKVSYSRLLAYAAVVSIFILSGVVLYNMNQYSKEHPLAATQNTMAGEFKEFKLPDGTTITMNGASSVSYELTENARKIKLSGQAHFEVAPNKNAPFSIVTPKGTVTVLGTGFDVVAYPNKEMSVSVNHGKVKVQHDNKQLILTKGMSAITNNSDLNSVDMDSTTVIWRGQFIEFNNANLSKVCTAIENKYNVQLDKSNLKSQNLQFTGKFKQNATIDEICNVINTALKVNLTRKSAK